LIDQEDMTKTTKEATTPPTSTPAKKTEPIRMKASRGAGALVLAALVVSCGQSSGNPSDAGTGTDTMTPTTPAAAVSLGLAGGYAILAKSGIATVPTSSVTGDLGVSPAAGTSITGFSLTADATNVFSTSPQVTGRIYAADDAVPTPADLTTAIGDMQLAFTDAAGRAAGVTELGAGNIGGMTLTARVYKWSSGLLVPTDVTLAGAATDRWIFQIAGDLTVATGVKIRLDGGALAKNIVWQVAGAVDLEATAHGEGVFLSQTSITLRTGASVNGRLMAQTAVNIDGSRVLAPTP
jgi:hypothetical protein